MLVSSRLDRLLIRFSGFASTSTWPIAGRRRKKAEAAASLAGRRYLGMDMA
jgi:hypothetical protein